MPERQTPENCNCGAPLVDKSRFCHMCGRPVFEHPAPEVMQILRPALPPQPSPLQSSQVPRSGSPPVGFGNPVALRVAVLMSLGTMFVEMIPVVNLLFIVWGVAGGWCGVLLYRRLTGFALDIRAGARLGSITGVLTFASLLVISTLTLTIGGQSEDIFKQFRKDPQMAQVLNEPVTLAAVFAFALVIMFVIIVGTSAAGGALGARYVSRTSANTQV
jgi:hypothetical protein